MRYIFNEKIDFRVGNGYIYGRAGAPAWLAQAGGWWASLELGLAFVNPPERSDGSQEVVDNCKRTCQKLPRNCQPIVARNC